MSEHHATPTADQAERPNVAPTLPPVPRGYTRNEPFGDYWSNVVLWTSLVLGLLPVSAYLGERIYVQVLVSSSWIDLSGLVVHCVMLLSLGYTIMLVVTYFLAAIICVIWAALLHTLKLTNVGVLGGACFGGFVGLAIILPTSQGSFSSFPAIALATTLGQIGGALGAWKTYQPSKDGSRFQHENIQLRFGMRQLLIVTAWLALLLTAMKVVGLLNRDYVNLLTAWLILQLTLLVIVRVAEKRAYRKIIECRCT